MVGIIIHLIDFNEPILYDLIIDNIVTSNNASINAYPRGIQSIILLYVARGDP